MFDIDNITVYLSNGVVYTIDEHDVTKQIDCTHFTPITKIKKITDGKFYFKSQNEITYFTDIREYSIDYIFSSFTGCSSDHKINNFNTIYYKYNHCFDSVIRKIIPIDNAIMIILANIDTFTLNSDGIFEKINNFDKFHHEISTIIQCYNRYFIFTSDNQLFRYIVNDCSKQFEQICNNISIAHVDKFHNALFVLDDCGILYHLTRHDELLVVELLCERNKILNIHKFYANNRILVIIDNDGQFYTYTSYDNYAKLKLRKIQSLDVIDVFFCKQIFYLNADYKLYTQPYAGTAQISSKYSSIQRIYHSHSSLYIVYSENLVEKISYPYYTYSQQVITLQYPISVKSKYFVQVTKSARSV